MTKKAPENTANSHLATGAQAPRLDTLLAEQESLLARRNQPVEPGNGFVLRYRNPVLTADHVPMSWRYDLNAETNPFMMERLGINAVFNPGAILLGDRFILVARVEGSDRKSFFAIAESATGIDQFRFWNYPIQLPETRDPDVNVYDMRLTAHEDGHIYGVFCTERKNPNAPPGDTSSAIAQAGICRTNDLTTWERLPDLVTPSAQQRNVVLHPEFVDGRYAFYTRPQDGFVETGSGGGMGWGLSDFIDGAVITNEQIIDPKSYHTIKELKNGQGPPPLKTDRGWLHLAHGVRGTAAGLRYVLYLLLTDVREPWRVIGHPGGYFLAPMGDERVGDVANVAFCNGWIRCDDDRVFVYYASSDTRVHVVETSVGRMLDYVANTPPDRGRSAASVQDRIQLIRRNARYGDHG